MGIVLHFPEERFGAVTRSTEQPHKVERFANWLRKAAGIRASASLGCDVSLEVAPNLVPMRHKTRSEKVAAEVVNYCHRRGYHGRVISEAIRVGLMRLKEGRETQDAIESAKTRADFYVLHGKPEGPDAA